MQSIRKTLDKVCETFTKENQAYESLKNFMKYTKPIYNIEQ